MKQPAPKDKPKSGWALKLGVIAVVYVTALFSFVALADEVREQEPLFFDQSTMQAVHTLWNPLLSQIVVATTDLGYVWWVGGVTLAVLVVLAKQRRFRECVFLSIAVGGSALTNLVLKALFQRDRPDLWERLVTENSYSFPSGHAMASASLAATLIVLAWPTRFRWVAVALGALYVTYIGFTRVYLGVHFPSDVVAGWAAAVVWVLTVAFVLYRERWYWGKKTA